MGEARTKEDRKSQRWLLWLTLGERYELRQLLFNRKLEDHASMDRNNNALDALAGEEDFEKPVDDEEAKEWLDELNRRLKDKKRAPLELSIDNISAVLDCIDALLKAKVLPGDIAYRVRRGLELLKDAKKGEAREGWVELAYDPRKSPTGDEAPPETKSAAS